MINAPSASVCAALDTYIQLSAVFSTRSPSISVSQKSPVKIQLHIYFKGPNGL